MVHSSASTPTPAATFLLPATLDGFVALLSHPQEPPTWRLRLNDFVNDLRAKAPGRDADLVVIMLQVKGLWLHGIDGLLDAAVDTFLELERRFAAMRSSLQLLADIADRGKDVLAARAVQEADAVLINWCEALRDARWDLIVFRVENKRSDEETKTMTYDELVASLKPA